MENTNRKTAAIFGASGLIGSFLLKRLLDDPNYGKVIVVVRKPLPINHPKLEMLTGDFNSLPALADQLVADDVFIALGTTKKQTPDERLYYQVDHDYPVLAARLAASNGAKSVLVVTAIGANAKSGVFYIRTKGETERDIIALNLPHTHIFRPSMIMGNRHKSRPMEKAFIGIFSLLNPLLIGPVRKYRGIQAEDIAKSMIAAANQPAGKMKIYEYDDMRSLIS